MTIRALAPLIRSEQNLELSFAGAVRDQDYYDRLRAMIDEQNIADSVHFLGWRDDIPALLGKSDLLILSSTREGIPHVIREAMFAQVPVVATHVGGVPEAVRHGETGYLVQLNDHDYLRECVEELLQDRDLREEMGRNALEFAEERFSNSAWIESYSEHLSSV
jgi:glycosyltransferase involved in cell wall biosynthesis